VASASQAPLTWAQEAQTLSTAIGALGSVRTWLAAQLVAIGTQMQAQTITDQLGAQWLAMIGEKIAEVDATLANIAAVLAAQ
jgi:hypothetical protein